jgi:hypothetical protein
MPRSYLVYIYKHRSRSHKPDLEKLQPGDLLLAPAFVNQMGWTKGFFKIVGHEAIRDEDLVPTACFQDLLKGGYRDAKGGRSHERSEPCGIWAMGNHRTLGDEISRALGLASATE